MDTQDDFLLTRPPTAERPLMGVTLLLVEDSRFACEAMRMMASRSGARLRRADSIASARQHLRIYRPSVAIIDLGLPDGYGEDLISELSRATPRVQAILATSGDPDGEMRAKISGADGFMCKPFNSLAAFQAAILDHMPIDRRPKGPRRLPTTNIAPDRIAYRDDLSQIARLIATNADPRTLDYVHQFLSGVAECADDQPILQALDELQSLRQNGQPIGPQMRNLSDLIETRLLETEHNSLN